MRRSVTVLGATGSIGRNTLDVIAGHPHLFDIDTLTAQKNVTLLAEQARAMRARHAVIGDESLYAELKDLLHGTQITCAAGAAAITAAAARPVDVCMAAIVGAAGIAPTVTAAATAKTLAIANKESIVCAPNLLFETARKHQTTLLPVDSEHNAIFQLLDINNFDHIKKVYLTASGGPFLRLNRSELKNVTPAMALKHPTWSMGAKISIDSATMVNKALEIIETHYLFNLKSEKISALIHPQSIVHALVEYSDGSILNHMGAPDMRTAISYALGWPKRIKTTGQYLNLNNSISLIFEPIDIDRFPAVKIAYDCLAAADTASAIFSCANEVAVDAFLSGHLPFDCIEAVSQEVLNTLPTTAVHSLDDIFSLIKHVHVLAKQAVNSVQ